MNELRFLNCGRLFTDSHVTEVNAKSRVVMALRPIRESSQWTCHFRSESVSGPFNHFTIVKGLLHPPM